VTVEARSITPLEKANLRERVLRALRAAIISGELTPGEVYSAPSLAATFGVSATPVREAMLDLAKENLVVVVPNKGFRVTVVDEEQLDQITAVRRLLEPPVVAEVTDLVPAEDFAGLLSWPRRSSTAPAPGTWPSTPRRTASSTCGCSVTPVTSGWPTSSPSFAVRPDWSVLRRYSTAGTWSPQRGITSTCWI
jgi:DNA-binding transcriptional regulator YhcF (GntR family)